MQTLDFVIPVFNEEESLEEFHRQLSQTPLPEGFNRRYIYVNDGSIDQTQQILEKIASRDPTVAVIQLSRNFGHQAALSAGLEAARGSVVISLDGDGQHPPSVIPEMLRLYQEGNDIVRAQRIDPFEPHTQFKRLTSRWFYRLVSMIGEIELHPGVSDFRLLSRRALNALLQLPEYHRFYRGMTVWIGFPTTTLTYDPGLRIGGKSKYTLRKMLRLASDGLFSFSLMPLRIGLFLGALFVALFSCELFFIAIVWFINGRAALVPGWTSLILILTLSSGINMVLLGIVGVYIGMIFREVKHRPVYIVRSVVSSTANIGEGLGSGTRKTDRTTVPERSQRPSGVQI